MTHLKIKTALTAVTLAAATLAMPLSAQAGDYNRKCNDTTNGVAGAVIGGTVGAAIGDGLAGRGDSTEAGILGAIIGGIAGAAIGDSASGCENDHKYRTTTTRYPTTTTYTPRHSSHGQTRGYSQNSGYSRNSGYNRTSGYQTVGHRSSRRSGYNGYSTGYNSDPLYQIDREIERVRFEGDNLKRELKYSRGYNSDISRRLTENGYRLEQLKRERKRIKKYTDSRKNYRQPQTRRGHYHGTSRNLCYSNH